MRPEKQAIFEEVKGNLSTSGYLLMVDYKGMKVEHFSTLRARLRKSKTRVSVMKNTLVKRVATDFGWQVPEGLLKGSGAGVYGSGDAVEACKILVSFAGEAKVPTVRGGWLGGAPITAEDVVAMSKLPARSLMLGRVVGTIAAPMSQLVGVLQQKICSVLYVLKAIEEKKSQSAG